MQTDETKAPATCKWCGEPEADHYPHLLFVRNACRIPAPRFAPGPTHDELAGVVKLLLSSAAPHPVDHPKMTAAWKEAKRVLSLAEEPTHDEEESLQAAEALGKLDSALSKLGARAAALFNDLTPKEQELVKARFAKKEPP
jgi:hypothetical protein